MSKRRQRHVIKRCTEGVIHGRCLCPPLDARVHVVIIDCPTPVTCRSLAAQGNWQ